MKDKLTWNLCELFENSIYFYEEIDKLTNELEDLLKWENIMLDANNLFKLLNLKWNMKERANKVLIYGSFLYYKNIASKKTIHMKNIAEQFVSKLDSSLSFIDKKIIEYGKEKIDFFILHHKELTIYKMYFNNIFRKQKHIQNKKKNFQIKELNDSIHNSLTKYNNIIHKINFGKLLIDDEKIQLTTSNIGEYLSSSDREIRRKTYCSFNESFKESENLLADILNHIYTDRLNISKLEGYPSVLEKSLFDDFIDSDVLINLIQFVNENINIFQEYLKLKAEALSIFNPHLYDFGVSFDNGIKKKYTLEDAIPIIKNALTPLGKEYLSLIDFLVEHNHIDAQLDKKKHQSITFSWSSYSFMNYRETYLDLKNLTHELGHIIHAYLSEKSQPYIYSDSSIFVGETASLVNEILLNRYLYEQAANEEERLFYLSNNIDNYFVQIFKQTMYTEFELKLYNYVQNNEVLTTNLLETEYSILQKKYFGDFITFDICSNIEWVRLGHLYRKSYYVYKYATGFIMASSVVRSILNGKEDFSEKYLEFLSSGCKDDSLELLKNINIDFLNKKTIENIFMMMKNDILEFNKILQHRK